MAVARAAGAGVGDGGGYGWSKGVGDSNGCSLVGSKSKGAGVTTALATAVATAVARVAGAGVGDSGDDGCSEGADTPAMRAALDVLARLPADNNDDDKFADVDGGGGGGGGGRGTGGRMIINPRSVPAAICQRRRCGAGGNGTD